MDALAAASGSLVVSEVFGPTFQGEGPHLGQRAAFVRLGGCNLACSWCDTPYTWDARRHDLRAELHRRPVAQIVELVAGMDVGRAVLTGGEPLLWQDKPGWELLLTGLTGIGCRLEIETNGTIAPTAATIAHVEQFNVSPKLAHSGDPLHRRLRLDALAGFAGLANDGRAALKVVVQTATDIAEAAQLAHSIGFPLQAVYVMPEGASAQPLIGRSDLAQAALAHRLNMTTRLHVLLWGEERGR